MTRTWTVIVAGAMLACVATTSAQAEIEVIVPAGSQHLPAFSAPKLPLTPGFETNLSVSLARQARLLFPRGSGPSPTVVIGARAIPKSATRGVTTLADLVGAANTDMRAQDPAVEITEIPAVTDKAGRKLRVFAERAGNGSSYRMTAYTEEKGPDGEAYWTTFTLSAANRDAMATGTGPFQDLLRNYK